MTETDLSRHITLVFERLGCIVVRVQSGVIALGGRRVHCAKKGTPDRVVLFPNGVTRWVEVKFDKGKPSPEQLEWRRRAERLGHIVDVVWSVEEAVALAREALQGGNREQH